MQIQLFATKSDLLPRIESIESKKELHYAILSMSKNKNIDLINSLLDVDEIGFNNSGKYVLGTQYLVVEKKYDIKSRSIEQRDGGVLYDVGPLENPHSIIFQPGGIYGDNCIIIGSLGTVSESEESIRLYQFFKKEITKNFKKIKGVYVGPEAVMFARSGYRLITMHIEQSPEYDLSID